MVYLALTENQTYAVEYLSRGNAVPKWCAYQSEWDELETIMPLQFEGSMVYAAILSVPGFEMSASEQNATQAADWIMDERMDGAGMYRGE